MPAGLYMLMKKNRQIIKKQNYSSHSAFERKQLCKTAKLKFPLQNVKCEPLIRTLMIN